MHKWKMKGQTPNFIKNLNSVSTCELSIFNLNSTSWYQLTGIWMVSLNCLAMRMTCLLKGIIAVFQVLLKIADVIFKFLLLLFQWVCISFSFFNCLFQFLILSTIKYNIILSAKDKAVDFFHAARVAFLCLLHLFSLALSYLIQKM